MRQALVSGTKYEYSWAKIGDNESRTIMNFSGQGVLMFFFQDTFKTVF